MKLSDILTDLKESWTESSNVSQFVEEFRGNSLYEGLIKTHPIESTIFNVRMWLSKIKSFVNIKKVEGKDNTICVQLKSPTEENLKSFIIKFNNYGYFPSYIIINGIGEKFKEKDYFNYLKKLDNIIELFFEAKYDMVYSHNTHDVFYHVSYKEYEEKIEKSGLFPKTKDKISTHPARIYLSISKGGAIQIKENFKTSGFKGDFILVYLKLGSTIKLFVDPNFYSEGVYTYQNIPANSILKIEDFN